MQLELTNVITISVSAAGTGIGDYNTSNLALFTREDFDPDSFGDDGFKIYLSPKEVGDDFGTDSETYKMANSIFSQQPNILAGNGYLVVIPFADSADVVAVQHIAFASVPASGTWKLKHGADTSGSLAFNISAANLQIALRLLPGFSSITVSGDTTAGFDITFTGVSGAVTLLQVVNNALQNSTPEDITPVVTTTTAGTTASTETIDAAISRTEDLVQYFGILVAEISSEAHTLAAAAVVQALNKIAFWVQRDSATVDPGGLLDELRTGSFTKNRGLFYGADNDSDALVMSAAYAGRGLSTNFSGSNTTQTMHLKDLVGVQPDPSMTQTLLNKCKIAGADVYASFQGVAKVFCSGANKFFDQVYNLEWFVGALQVAGFNFLAEASTKIPQTEAGMSGLKGAYRTICEQARTNQYSAPGKWNSSTTFGDQSDFLQNIDQRGYYIFSIPVSQQTQTDRVARKAPLVQIALKEAGAVHSSAVIVNINE